MSDFICPDCRNTTSLEDAVGTSKGLVCEVCAMPDICLSCDGAGYDNQADEVCWGCGGTGLKPDNGDSDG